MSVEKHTFKRETFDISQQHEILNKENTILYNFELLLISIY